MQTIIFSSFIFLSLNWKMNIDSIYSVNGSEYFS